MVTTAKVFENGRITLPKAMRDQLGIATGDQVTLEVDGDVIKILSTRARLLAAQAKFMKAFPDDRSLADELIADRRREAAREDAE